MTLGGARQGFSIGDKRRWLRSGASQPWQAGPTPPLEPAPGTGDSRTVPTEAPETPQEPEPPRCRLCGIELAAVDEDDWGNGSPDGLFCTFCHENYPERIARRLARMKGAP